MFAHFKLETLSFNGASRIEIANVKCLLVETTVIPDQFVVHQGVSSTTRMEGIRDHRRLCRD